MSGMDELDEFLSKALDEELPGFVIPNIGEMSNEFLIDKLGIVKDRLRRLKKMEKLLIEAVKSRNLATGARGNQFEITLQDVPMSLFNQDLAKGFLTDEQIVQCYVDITQHKLLVKST